MGLREPEVFYILVWGPYMKADIQSLYLKPQNRKQTKKLKNEINTIGALLSLKENNVQLSNSKMFQTKELENTHSNKMLHSYKHMYVYLKSACMQVFLKEKEMIISEKIITQLLVA